MKTLSELASTCKPVDWSVRPSMEVNLTDSELIVYVKASAGTTGSGPFTLEEALSRKLLTLHNGARTRGATHTLVFLYARLSVTVRPIDREADATEEQAEQDYRELVKKREQEQRDLDFHNKHGRFPTIY